MTVLSPSYKPGAVVVLPFPFTDQLATKRRPALVLSQARFAVESGHVVVAMVTSTEQTAWPHDVPLQYLSQAGLTKQCLVRMKLFTLDTRLILREAGRLHPLDWAHVQAALLQSLSLANADTALHQPLAPLGAS